MQELLAMGRLADELGLDVLALGRDLGYMIGDAADTVFSEDLPTTGSEAGEQTRPVRSAVAAEELM